MENIMFICRCKLFLLVLLVGFTSTEAGAVEAVSLALSKDAYRVGEIVQLRLTLKNDTGTKAVISGTVMVKVAGGVEMARVTLLKDVSLAPGANFESGYREIWKIPQDALLGLYDLEFSSSGITSPIVTHFVAYRQDLALELLETERKQYVAGDIIRVRAIIRNLGQAPLRHLKLVLGRGYPWISGFGRGTGISGAPPEQVYTYPKPITLQPGQALTTEWFDTMKASLPGQDRPDIF